MHLFVIDSTSADPHADLQYCDDKGRPWENVRVQRTAVLDHGEVGAPPTWVHTRLDTGDALEGADRLEFGKAGATAAKARDEEETRREQARTQARVLEILGDIKDADAVPDENVLFVCKMNPVTRSKDLELIFSRFGDIASCDVIKDAKTGESLCYAFIAFREKKSAEQAYLKMEGVLIDDRRIHVDFGQSMERGQRLGEKRSRGPSLVLKGERARRYGGELDEMVFDGPPTKAARRK